MHIDTNEIMQTCQTQNVLLQKNIQEDKRTIKHII